MTKSLVAIVAAEAVLAVFLCALVFGAEGAAANQAPPAAAPPPAANATPAVATRTPLDTAAGTVAPAPTAGSERREAGSAGAKYDPNDPVGVMLVGTVRWSDGTPVDSPGVRVVQGDEDRYCRGCADGTYALPRLAPGEWQVSVGSTGAVDFAAAVAVTDDAVQSFDAVLERSHAVRVLAVTPDGKDAQTELYSSLRSMLSLHVVGQRDRFPERLAPSEYGTVFAGDAKWNGERNSKDGFLGTLHFPSPPPAHAALLLRHFVLAQQVIEPGQGEVKFVVDLAAVAAQMGSVTLRVVDAESGAPLTTARVTADRDNVAGAGKPVDAEGRVQITNVFPGQLKAQIFAKDRENYLAPFRLEPGQQLDLGEIRVGALLPLVGRVVDEVGKPATAYVTWTELKWRNAPTPFVRNRSARIEADGTFSLWGTGRGRIAVTASASDGRIAVGVFDNPPAQPVELRLVVASKVTVTRPTDPTKAYTVTLFGAGRQPVTAFNLEPRQKSIVVSLPAGKYAFEVHDEAQRLVQSGDVVFGAERATLEIR